MHHKMVPKTTTYPISCAVMYIKAGVPFVNPTAKLSKLESSSCTRLHHGLSTPHLRLPGENKAAQWQRHSTPTLGHIVTDFSLVPLCLTSVSMAGNLLWQARGTQVRTEVYWKRCVTDSQLGTHGVCQVEIEVHWHSSCAGLV